MARTSGNEARMRSGEQLSGFGGTAWRRRRPAEPLLRVLLGALLVVGSTAALGADAVQAAGPASHFTALPAHMSTERGDAVAAVLPEGQVLIAGGQNELGFAPSAELFNPASGTFTKLEGPGRETTEERQGAVAAALPDGEVLIAGGSIYAVNGYRSSAELFDPASDTFTKLEGPGSEMTVAREHPVAATLPDGDVLIAGGSIERKVGPIQEEEDVASAELFDPTTDTFTKLEGPAHEMTEARWGAVAAVLPNGKVLIAGGRTQSSAELFDPTSDTFTKLEGPGSSMTEARQGATAATLPNGGVLIAGGLNGVHNLSNAELFDPTSDTFTKLEGLGSSMSEVREFAVSSTLPDGRVLIAGGVNEHSWLSEADVFLTAAQASVVGGNFGDQTVGESRASSVIVTNLGAQNLSISGASLEGPNQADWMIDDNGCVGRSLAFAQSCVISLLFSPSQEGSLEAMLKLIDNEPSEASVTRVTGSGVSPSQGPQGPAGQQGATGSSGAQGERGSAGATGQTGAQGAAGTVGAAGATGAKGTAGATGLVGPHGPAGDVELVICSSTKAKSGELHQQCKVELGASPFKFTGRGRKLAASLYRGGRLYAKGFALLSSTGKTQLLLGPLRTLSRGRYTLAIDNKHKQQRDTIAIG